MENKDKTAEEILRNKIRKNYSIPEKFYLNQVDFLNASLALQCIEEYAQQESEKAIKDFKEIAYTMKHHQIKINHLAQKENSFNKKPFVFGVEKKKWKHKHLVKFLVDASKLSYANTKYINLIDEPDNSGFFAVEIRHYNSNFKEITEKHKIEILSMSSKKGSEYLSVCLRIK